MFDYSNYIITYQSDAEKQAADILSKELRTRGTDCSDNYSKTITLIEDDSFRDKDAYKIDKNENGLTISEKGIRG